MACETQMSVTSFCSHPAITFCQSCRCGLCSAHILECEICEAFLCQDCEREHYRQHELKARQMGRAS